MIQKGCIWQHLVSYMMEVFFYVVEIYVLVGWIAQSRFLLLQYMLFYKHVF
jgi:hypothetical protein